MDIRNEIVNTVMLKMQEIIDSKSLEILQNALLTGLNQYEITERSTEIVVRDGTAEGLLRSTWQPSELKENQKRRLRGMQIYSAHS